MIATTRTMSGYSLPLNILAVVVNLCSVALLFMAFHPAFEDAAILLGILGGFLLLASVAALAILQGKLLMATVARTFTGSLFIVSGLIKANDPIGFSYKLEEYFEDGALAYRIKEWFNAPGFSLEGLAQSAVGIAVAVCILEIVLGVLLIIGGRLKLNSWILLITMLFFTFLTWHTATCNPHRKFRDQNTYSLSDTKQAQLASLKIEEAKTNKDIHVISRNSREVVVEEMLMPQCVNDCGCFGDALKGSVGRSLTPQESLWKDLVLLYFTLWILFSKNIIEPNSVSQNWRIIPVSLLLITGFCWVFGWYFPLLFGVLALLGSLWIYRSGGRMLGNHFGSAIFATVLSFLFVWFCLTYDTLKDYRPYAKGSDLNAKMRDVKDGVIQNLLVYKNLQTGELKTFDAAGSDYLQGRIWEKTDLWKFVRTDIRIIVPPKLASIDSNAFNPSIMLSDVSAIEKKIPLIASAGQPLLVRFIRLKDLDYNTTAKVPLEEYNLESYPETSYTRIDTVMGEQEAKGEIGMRDFILSQDRIIILFSRNLKKMSREHIAELRTLFHDAEKNGIPFIFVTNASRERINAFRVKNKFPVPAFTMDETELKVISRSNPGIMILTKGKVAGKYPHNSLPEYDWIVKNLFKTDAKENSSR